MTPIQVESWALREMDRVTGKRPAEGSHAECKTDWPTDSPKTARQLAGRANAAGGHPVLWIIGVDEKAGLVPGVSLLETSTWFAQVTSCFDGIWPTMLIDIPVNYGGKTVVAMLFETNRAPYVVKTGKDPQFEVPWREAGGTRTARREDLVRILVPLAESPGIDVLTAKLHVNAAKEMSQYGEGRTTIYHSIDFRLRMYVVPQSDRTLVMPFHRCSAVWRFGPRDGWKSLRTAHIEPATYLGAEERFPASQTVRVSQSEAIIEGAGMIEFVARARMPPQRIEEDQIKVEVQTTLAFADVAEALTFPLELGLREWRPGDRAVWSWKAMGYEDPEMPK